MASKVQSEQPKVQPAQPKPQPAPVTRPQPAKPKPAQVQSQEPPLARTPQEAVQSKLSSLPQAIATGPNKLHVNGTTKSLTGSKARESLSTITFKPSSNSRNAKRPLSAFDLEQRLDVYRKTKNAALEEIHTKFDILVEMLKAKDPKRTLIDMEIDSLKKPFIDLQNMSNDMKKLNHL